MMPSHAFAAAGIAVLGAGLLIGAPEVAVGQAYLPKVWTLPSPVLPLGYCSLSVNSTTATSFAACSNGIPAAPGGTLGPIWAIVEASAQVFFRDDGTAPTTSAGFPLASNTNMNFTESPLSSVQFIASSSAQLNVLFYAVR